VKTLQPSLLYVIDFSISLREMVKKPLSGKSGEEFSNTLGGTHQGIFLG
jgi:hypothetical protein